MRVDPANRRLTRGERELPLEPKAFAVLTVLLERADQLVTRDELLDAVWGHRYVTPATLNRAMTLLRRVFDDDADQPRAIRTVHGAGYRYIGDVRRIEPARDEESAPVILPWQFQLPAKLERLVGRAEELRRLGEMLASHRAVTIVGAGGMGKTQCALEAARLGGERYADGVWFFDLSPLKHARAWLAQLATALPAMSALLDSPAELLSGAVSALAGRQLLFVLDNCDRLAMELGPIVLALLRACPALRVLATSRQRLDFVGERLMWLAPLTLPPPSAEALRAPLEDIGEVAAVELLMARAADVQPS
ncbi:MAG TPA: winged helix-turn-helix domain-containing protein, partial [Burkholderiaceae bacterium]|nr:winged helix-turn-helix domain-containing protein [Burkholderiaceae bacterium]